MTGPEWAAFALELDQTFKGDFGPRSEQDAAGAAQEASYIGHFGDVDYGVAVAALHLLVRDGQVWLPTPGELFHAVERIQLGRGVLPREPEFAAVWTAVSALIVRHATDTTDVAFVAAVSKRCGEGAARWAQARGRRALGLEQSEGDHRGPVLHRLEQEYQRFAAAAKEDQKVGAAIERAGRRTELGAGGDGPRRLGGAMAALAAGQEPS